MATLSERIEARIRAIPANNPGYISVVQSDLGQLLASDLLERIAMDAADEARKFWDEEASDPARNNR